MHQQELIPHLFRTEYSKIAAVLCKYFGADKLDLAEDIASETFLCAMETWPYKGIPENPVAWLYTVAKNKTKNHLKHHQVFTSKISKHIAAESRLYDIPEVDLSEQNISDSMLQMMFAICHPAICAEAQIGLCLRILCGFGIEEIANAFLTSKETINKRLFRAKEKLRTENILIALPPASVISSRLENVITTLYLIFNEGYYSESNENIIREDLCLEAMRLTLLLTENELTNHPPANALFALMCFHSSRLAARKNDRGEIVLYGDQDENLWNHELIARGAEYLHRASKGEQLSRFHLEANIAFWHTIKEDSKEKWQTILRLYDLLLQTDSSPIAAINRAFALSKVKGNAAAIADAEQLHLTGNHYYHTLLGELYKDVDPEKSRASFEKAIGLAKTNADRQIIRDKLRDG